MVQGDSCMLYMWVISYKLYLQQQYFLNAHSSMLWMYWQLHVLVLYNSAYPYLVWMTRKVMENTLKFIGQQNWEHWKLIMACFSPKHVKVGVTVRSSGSFITDMKNLNQTSDVVCGQQFHSCCLVSSGPALLLISCLRSRGTKHLIWTF